MTTSLGWLYSVVPVRHCLARNTFSFTQRGPRCWQQSKHCFYATAASYSEHKKRLQIHPTKIWLPDERYAYMLGRQLAKGAQSGDVLLLYGELGAGKTSIARGYIHAARRDNSIEVTSPTYLLVNVYPPEAREASSPVPEIYHMDLWRLESASDRPLVDFEQVFSQYISLIEWPDRLKNLLPSNRLDVKLEYPPPAQQGDKADDSDPWGFGTGDFDDSKSSRSGRFVSLIAHGDIWRERAVDLLDSTSLNAEGHCILLDAKD